MLRSRIPLISLWVAASFMGASCSVGPDFTRPAAPEAESYAKTPQAERTSASATGGGQSQRFVRNLDIPADWWTLFRSRKLNALIDRGLKANPSFEAALAALRVAQENALAQQGKFFPLVEGALGASRLRSPTNPLGSPPVVGTDEAGNAITKNPYNVITSQVTVSYTFDVWGQNRRAVESLQAQTDSQRFQAEAARLTLASNIALAAIQEASLREQIAATQELIQISTKMLEILRRQFNSGYSNRIDVAAQEAQLAQTVATLPPLQKQLAQERNLITALTGRYPNEEPAEKFMLASFVLPRDLPVSLPSKLIEQRPDVRSAEELLHSASAQIGVATANMLPNITLNGNVGQTALALGNVADYFSKVNFAAAVAGGLTQPIFDGFTLLHQKRATEAAFDQSFAQYRSTVIAALQNVADTLRALQADADALRAASEFERAAKISLDLVRQQFDLGYANVLLLLNAQQTYLQARLTTVQARANRLADTVALYQALGGGWWNRPEPLVDEPRSIIAVSTDTR
ncbi:efflux transporter outer membrane subunit [Microbacteriaceae bacterium K1510]|nr:efflux transporter outer membrane subunit [Microbacteriaceae bacterium K1510]